MLKNVLPTLDVRFFTLTINLTWTYYLVSS